MYILYVCINTHIVFTTVTEKVGTDESAVSLCMSVYLWLQFVRSAADRCCPRISHGCSHGCQHRSGNFVIVSTSPKCRTENPRDCFWRRTPAVLYTPSPEVTAVLLASVFNFMHMHNSNSNMSYRFHYFDSGLSL